MYQLFKNLFTCTVLMLGASCINFLKVKKRARFGVQSGCFLHPAVFEKTAGCGYDTK